MPISQPWPPLSPEELLRRADAREAEHQALRIAVEEAPHGVRSVLRPTVEPAELLRITRGWSE